VATATLAAVIGWGGLGTYIVEGFALQDNVEIFVGGLLVAALAFATELAMAGLQRLATPAPLRGGDAGRTTTAKARTVATA
jgi:osmoprotectant transport system permease protein